MTLALKYDVRLTGYEISPSGELLFIMYQVSCIEGENRLIPKEPRNGKIDPNKTKLFSASFNRFVKLYKNDKGNYCFKDPRDKDNPYEVIQDIITLCENATTEYYMLMRKL